MMEQHFFYNDFPMVPDLGDTEPHLVEALEQVLIANPLRVSYPPGILNGIMTGPTAIAYLFLHVAEKRPQLVVSGRPALYWARQYMVGERDLRRCERHTCGISSEKLAYEAVRAAITKDVSHVENFVAHVNWVLDGDYGSELHSGRAGTLYMLRLIRHWVPGSGALVEDSIRAISETIMEDGPEWTWKDRRDIGAVHGDIGIVTQLVLTTPSLAPRMMAEFEQLLSFQTRDGNWPDVEGPEGDASFVQICHGAPGYVLSLLSLRPYFPGLEDQIDMAISRGREYIWHFGILRKNPCLCHGLIGNGLALPAGEERNTFLNLAKPESLPRLLSRDPAFPYPLDSSGGCSLLTSFEPGAAWAWLVYEQPNATIIAYNDI